MDKLSIELKNCYGIKYMKHDFLFTKGNAHILYAPNGTMKSSLAKVFLDISLGNSPKDVIYPNRESKCIITDEKSETIAPESIFVIESEKSEHKSKRISTLLVNNQLKTEYEEILIAIDEKKELLMKGLRSSTGMRKDIEVELCNSFSRTEKDFFSCLEEIQSFVQSDEPPLIVGLKYKDLYNKNIIDFVGNSDFKTKIEEYIKKYDELIEGSAYFKKGVFNHNNAIEVSKNLKNNGFFIAEHEVLLNKNGEKIEVKSQEELDKIIQDELDKILKDKELKKRFDAIDQALTKNAELKTFRDIIENNPGLITELNNPNEYRKKIWISYLKSEKEKYQDLIDTYKCGKEKIEKIINLANNERTEWQNVVDIFNKRFSVPFVIKVENQDDVILKEASPNIIFNYVEEQEQRIIERNELQKVLSTGEKRALYILDIIFEIEARKKDRKPNIFIIDDLADSFDYKNKYAIIQYLNDIFEENNFYALILTHNFDFYRTVQSRLDLNREQNCHMAYKTDSEIKIVQAQYLNVFENWKKSFHKNKKILIAMIPFVRNLIEYTIGDNNSDYIKLTALLHIKRETRIISTKELEQIFNKILGKSVVLEDERVFNLILTLADECCSEIEGINLENKLILSIAIRLKAEDYMISKINDVSLTNDIKGNQTAKLIKLYKRKYNDETIKILDSVLLMTPENIHLNSFMYEPILDISDQHLKELYKTIKNLTP